MKEYIAIKKWTDNYNESAIYSLVDDEGKRYIGQAIKLQERLDTHRRQLNNVCKNKETTLSEGQKLIDAVACGKRFHVEVLRKIPFEKSTINEMRKWEAYYLDLYGGVDNTYNSTTVPPPNHFYKPYDDVCLRIRLDSDFCEQFSTDDEIQTYIKELIRQDIRGSK